MAESLISKKKIKKRSDFRDTDESLYNELRKRGLWEKVAPEVVNRGTSRWKGYTDAELVRYADEYAEINDIYTSKELKRKAPELYKGLAKRGLITRTGLVTRYSVLSDEEILILGKKEKSRKEIKKRGEMCMKCSGIYHQLRKRNLLEEVFPAH